MEFKLSNVDAAWVCTSCGIAVYPNPKAINEHIKIHEEEKDQEIAELKASFIGFREWLNKKDAFSIDIIEALEELDARIKEKGISKETEGRRE